MIGIISAGVAPCLALLAFFYLKDRFETEPFSLVFKAFIYGVLLVFPIMFIQYAFYSEGFGQSIWFQTFFLTGLLEEFFKWFIFLQVVYRHVYFDYHYDGIVYGVAISLGFASLENVFYILGNGIEYVFTRAIFPVSSHALFGVILGYYMGKSKFSFNKQKRWLLIALVIPAFLHGLYDYILLRVESSWIYVMVPFMLFLWMFALRKVKIANNHNPHEPFLYVADEENTKNVL